MERPAFSSLEASTVLDNLIGACYRVSLIALNPQCQSFTTISNECNLVMIHVEL